MSFMVPERFLAIFFIRAQSRYIQKDARFKKDEGGTGASRDRNVKGAFVSRSRRSPLEVALKTLPRALRWPGESQNKRKFVIHNRAVMMY